MDGKKIKIVRIINRFNIGGPTYNAAFLTRFMSDEFETILVGGVPDEDEKDSLHILKAYGVDPIILPELKRNPSLTSDRKAFKKLKLIIEEHQPDIVHTHASKAGLLGRRAAFACKVPVVLHTFHGHVFHSYFGKVKTELIKNIERRLAKKSTGIIAISDIQKEELVKTHKICIADKVKVIPLGFDLGKFQENKEERRKKIRDHYQLSDDEVAIAIIGRLAPIKDHGFFLDVIEKLLRTTIAKIKVFIVGDGGERTAIEERVREINTAYPSAILMTSWIYDIAEFNQGMDIICLTSKNEGTPVSLIEAQASGLPVISTDVGGVRNIIANEKSGFVIKRGDSETYVEKLRLLVENSKERRKFGVYGVNHVIERYHYQRLVKDMENYYKALLSKK